jgi:hypothetical protein
MVNPTPAIPAACVLGKFSSQSLSLYRLVTYRRYYQCCIVPACPRLAPEAYDESGSDKEQAPYGKEYGTSDEFALSIWSGRQWWKTGIHYAALWCDVVHNEGGHQLRDNFVDLQMSKDVLQQLLETRPIRRARC